MAFTARYVAFDTADAHAPRRRYAWSVFAVLFGLMVVDYIDRQIVVSMFPHLKSHWNLTDSQLGALVSIMVGALVLIPALSHFLLPTPVVLKRRTWSGIAAAA